MSNYDIDEISTIKSKLSSSCFSDYSSFNHNNNFSLVDKKLLGVYMKIWSAFSQFVLKSTLEGNCFVDLHIGYFYPSKVTPGKYAYSPTLELLEKHGIILLEDVYNISPKNRAVNFIWI